MLSDEEKKAIESLIEIREFANLSSNLNTKINQLNAIDIILNLIEKQQKEIEHQKEKRENQKKELAILNEKQKEFNKLVNTVNSYEGQFKRQQKEIEELRVRNFELEFFDTNKKWEDKIKAKIEELIKEGNYRTADNPNGRVHFQKEITDYQIEVLQSLLEKE